MVARCLPCAAASLTSTNDVPLPVRMGGGGRRWVVPPGPATASDDKGTARGGRGWLPAQGRCPAVADREVGSRNPTACSAPRTVADAGCATMAADPSPLIATERSFTPESRIAGVWAVRLGWEAVAGSGDLNSGGSSARRVREKTSRSGGGWG